MKKNKNGKGFTLVELIIVLAVLLVLSVLAVLAFTNLQEKFVEGARRSDAATVCSQINTVNNASTKAVFTTITDVFTAYDGEGLFVIQTDSETEIIDLDLSVRVEASRWAAVADFNKYFAVEFHGGDATTGSPFFYVPDPS